MKEKPNEWVSIADLMAGVMAVVMLLLVISVLQSSFAEIKHKQEIENLDSSRKSSISQILIDVRNSFSKRGADNLVSVDVSTSKIILRDSAFDRGSACVTKEARTALKTVEDKITSFFNEVEGAQIYVEGHTDNIPVSQPVTDFGKFCTVYDDNFTLSAARAREARRLLIASIDPEAAMRVAVAGFGDSHPIAGIALSDPRNRRVEIRFAVSDTLANGQNKLVTKEFFNGLLKLVASDDWKTVSKKMSMMQPHHREPVNEVQAAEFKQRGLAALAENQFNLAIDNLEKSFSLNPGDSEVAINLGDAYINIKKHDKAINSLLESLLLDPTKGIAWLRLSEAFAEKEKTEAAISAVKLSVYFAKDQQRAINTLTSLKDNHNGKRLGPVLATTIPTLSSIPSYKKDSAAK